MKRQMFFICRLFFMCCAADGFCPSKRTLYYKGNATSGTHKPALAL
ncbi:hypothetical protein [Agathobaculum desmolans]|nr:hypothetical protein [Agathobaculum desmolans]